MNPEILHLLADDLSRALSGESEGCPECEHAPWKNRIIVMREGEPEPAIPHCPHCGAEPTVVVLRTRTVQPGGVS